MLAPDGYTFVFVAINLIVLFLFMRKFLFKPITNLMESRKSSIEQGLKDAENAKIEVAEARKKYEEQMKNIKLDGDKLVNEMKAKAAREYDEMIATAKKEALVIVQKGHEDVERERVEMIKQTKQQIAVLAIAAASKLVQANMDSETNKAMVDKFIDEAGAI